MGEDDMAVVDSQTRVRGIESLRVVDSSIFPTIPNGNLNSPTIMTAERAADLIKGKGMLEASDAEVGLGRDWETLQRSVSTSARTLGRAFVTGTIWRSVGCDRVLVGLDL